MQAEIPVITIDGPGGSGKGTIGQMLSDKLGWHFLDSGALYRVLALAVMQQKIAIENETKLEQIAQHLAVEFVPSASSGLKILLAGNDVSQAIRTQACAAMASQTAAIATVRSALLARQRAFRKLPGLVADGRDMGTVVFPDANLKFFFQASPKERARRRFRQLQQKGINVSLADVIKDLQQRDKRDEERLVAPLQSAQDAVMIDTTALAIDEVFAQVMVHVKEAEIED